MAECKKNDDGKTTVRSVHEVAARSAKRVRRVLPDWERAANTVDESGVWSPPWKNTSAISLVFLHPICETVTVPLYFLVSDLSDEVRSILAPNEYSANDSALRKLDEDLIDKRIDAYLERVLEDARARIKMEDLTWTNQQYDDRVDQIKEEFQNFIMDNVPDEFIVNGKLSSFDQACACMRTKPICADAICNLHTVVVELWFAPHY